MAKERKTCKKFRNMPTPPVPLNDVIGPENVAMIGGQRAFWIKTKAKEGKAVVTLTSETLGTQVLTFDVRKTAVE